MANPILTDAQQWELMCLDERVKNAQMVLGLHEGQRAQAKARILTEHGCAPGRAYLFRPDGAIVPAEQDTADGH